MLDMMNMFGKVKEMQAKLKEAQDNLVKVQATGESGGGMVKVIVNGKKQVIKLDIDNDLLKPSDKEMLQDLIIAAMNKALDEVEEKAREELKKATQGTLPNIPGLDLGSMFS
ncbi:YbaB/EbfC family nucleoid-associated protein [Cytophagaceae bacterium DM2B3-1]|uniref:Nucleoid-associated protein QNI19_01410 n=1 Tax=Xanthocytophaga flava TaxID=3048013 RepID=A0ABT7CD12_9BACT|nr:YbaB/EbfC family nucleoid-associated protein [Xanthocytophaga flavus]MDJ1470591.1 YbaB/EbfC family nucleoid-associated protein [Xanthocytophaga flavus]MDJ1491566.1 YbaB/EbfC family nucleoid-associated protein [Xanthocytophaga flavus]